MGKGKTIHGCTTNGKHHPLYSVWSNIKSRCYNPNHPDWDHYGARGIDFHDEWRNDFIPFANYCIDNGWKHGLDIDRIENEWGYHPGNIRFITHKNNLHNQILIRANNTSGYRGIWYWKARKKWKAQIMIDEKIVYLGVYKTAEDAAFAYDRKVDELNDGRPKNFPEPKQVAIAI